VAAIIISDASPLIALARVDGLGWLQALFNEVLITEAVLSEVLTGSFAASEARIEAAIAAGWLRAVQCQSNAPVLPDLDEGEEASIRLAIALGGETLLLIDERAGRSVAQEFGLQLAGTAAVIGLAKQRGLIASARSVFAELHASDFRIAAAVIQTVLERCGE
jgi:predicted nucleic acid-binding protein